MRKHQSFFISLIFLSSSCFSQQTDLKLNGDKQFFERSVTLSGFPSRDTISITFYKKDVWFKLVKMQDLVINTQPEACRDCQEILTDAFLDNLMALKSETFPTLDCRILSDTIIEGKKYGTIEDFYMVTDLAKETIRTTKGKKTTSASYIDPRLALKYCKSNKNRLAFIKMSDRLLKIK